MSTQRRPANPRIEAELRARARTVRRSKAVTAAAGFGGFASLVAVLIGHPAQSASAATTTTSTTQSSSPSPTTSPSGSSGTGATTSTVVPDTVTSGS